MITMRPKSIILIEDDLNLRQSIALILQRAGYLVTATDCVHKAMDIIKSGKYHLVISDINMSEIFNVLLPKVLANHPETSIVILTDQAIPEIDKKDKLPCAYFLEKPVAPERLLDCVAMVLVKQATFNRNKEMKLLINQTGNKQ